MLMCYLILHDMKLKIRFLLGDAEEVGIPKTNTWYFNGYNTDECFDKYFADPTEQRPPTCYLGFPCTKVCVNVQVILLIVYDRP